MAHKQWAKVWRDVGLSTRLAALMERDPISYGLFWHLKALADDFGRYPNDPERFLMEGAQRMLLNGVITPLNGVQALSNYVELGLARLYEVDGVEYLELCDFHTHERPNWGSVSAPEYPAPPDWTPPPSLVEFLENNYGKRNITARRYGITPENAPKSLQKRIRAEYEPRSTDIEPRSTEMKPRSTDIEPRSTDIEPTGTSTVQYSTEQNVNGRAPSLKDGALLENGHVNGNGAARACLEDARAATATAGVVDTPQPSCPTNAGNGNGHNAEYDRDALAELLPAPSGVLSPEEWYNLVPTWVQTHPPPTDAADLYEYRQAAMLWSAGVVGPENGYEFPPPPRKPLAYVRGRQ